MDAPRPPSKRFVDKPFWPLLLGVGFVVSAIAGGLFALAASSSVDSTLSGRDNTASNLEAIIGIVFGSVGGVMLLAGIIGLGVASAAIRPALDLLIDADPQCQRWAVDAGQMESSPSAGPNPSA